MRTNIRAKYDAFMKEEKRKIDQQHKASMDCLKKMEGACYTMTLLRLKWFEMYPMAPITAYRTNYSVSLAFTLKGDMTVEKEVLLYLEAVTPLLSHLKEPTISKKESGVDYYFGTTDRKKFPVYISFITGESNCQMKVVGYREVKEPIYDTHCN